MNAFDIRLQTPVTELSGLYGRGAALRNLEGKLAGGQQGIVLVGPEGSGKTSLLKSFFTPEYRRRMILEKRRIITPPEVYPVEMTCTEVYCFLRDIVFHACALLEDCGQEDDYLQLLTAMDREASHTAKGRFFDLVDFLYGTLGYSVTLVLDQFEKFTCSSTISEEHHDMLNGLIDERSLQFVVATDYDMTKVVIGAGSYLIQKFGNGMVRLDGLEQADCRLLADELLAGDPISMGDGSVKAARQWSGGNPALLLSMLSRCYEIKRSGLERPDWLRDVVNPILEENRRLLGHWCRYLDEAELSAMIDEVLSFDQRDHPVTSAVRSALARLRDRGLLVSMQDNDARYDFCCLLLRRYLENRRSELITEEYTTIPGGSILGNLRQALQGGDLSRAIRLISSRSDEEMPVLFDALASNYGRDRAISQEEYASLGFSPESIAELRKNNARMYIMLDDAIRTGRMVHLLEEDAQEEPCDYSIYVYAFFRPLEKQILDCVFPLIEAWPSAGDIQALLASGRKSVCRLEKDLLSVAQYESFLKQSASKLAKLCRCAGIKDLSEARSWTVLARDISTARRIRNGSTHPEALQNLSPDYHSEIGVTRKAGRASIKAAYTDHRLFHRLPACLEAAAYLRRKPHVLGDAD